MIDKRAEGRRRREEATLAHREASQEVEDQRQDPARKVRKKKSRLKWQKIVSISSKIKETRHGKTSILTINADSLKLVRVEVPSKQQPRPRRIESRRKYGKGGATCTVSNIAKSSVVKSQSRCRTQLQPLIVPLCDSFSSDNDSIDSPRQRVSKKKQKKKQPKKIKSTPTGKRKNRATSANPLHNS